MLYLKHLCESSKEAYNMFKFFVLAYKTNVSACPLCNGDGELIFGYDNYGNPIQTKKCPLCDGRGVVDFNTLMDYLAKYHEEYKPEVINDKEITTSDDDIDEIEF